MDSALRYTHEARDARARRASARRGSASSIFGRLAMVGHIGAIAGGSGAGHGLDFGRIILESSGQDQKEMDELVKMLKEAKGRDDPLVSLSSVQSVTKLVTDQGAV